MAVSLKSILPSDSNVGSDLLCDICGNYLSIAPVFYIENIGFTCGRCDKINSRDNSNPLRIRQLLYEKLAKNSVFPCKYEENGCERKMKWDEVEQHENSCTFNHCICYFAKEEYYLNNNMEKCEWKGKCEELYKHLEDNHHSSFEGLPIRIKMQDGELKNNIFLVKIEEVSATVFFHFNDEACYFLVTASPKNEEILRDYKFFINTTNTITDMVSTSARKNILIKHNLNPSCDVEKFGFKINKSYFDFTKNESSVSLYVQDENISLKNNTLKPIVLLDCKFCGKKNVKQDEVVTCVNNHKFCKYCVNDGDSVCTLCEAKLGGFDLLSTKAAFVKSSPEGSIGDNRKYECVERCTWQGDLASLYSHCKKVGHNCPLNEYVRISPETEIFIFLFDANIFRLYLHSSKLYGIISTVHTENLSKNSYRFMLSLRNEDQEPKTISCGYLSVMDANDTPNNENRFTLPSKLVEEFFW